MRIFTGSRRMGNFLLGAAGFLLLCVSTNAQQPAARIAGEIPSQERTALRGSHPPLARAENEAGRVPGGTRLQGVSIVFSRTAEQDAELQALIAAQQDPASALYQQWLTPEQYGARFGMADADIATVTNWLEQQGFTVEAVSRSKNQITFSGMVAQVEQAFGTELHYYSANGERHFAPYADLMLPTSLASVVQAVTNLSTFRPRSHIVRKAPQLATQSHFTSSQSGNYFLTPKDVATIYNINAAYSAGLNGTGQSIAVVGQSPIVMSDIEHFQTASGVFTTPKDPILHLVPNTGTGTTPVTGDEAESDLDLEYSSTIAPGATIHFVYTGGNTNTSVWDSLQYAITSNLAPIISISYGLCEPLLGQSFYNSLNGILAQAATQGQTVVSASGDGGSADCAGMTGATTAQQQLSVDFPSSSQYVAGIGGTEFPSADVDPTNAASAQYWQPKSSTDIVSSALKYIPEQVWNDTTSGKVSSGGGGVSMFTPKPSWQIGVPGIPSGTSRLVPDISLSASPNNAGYLYCSSDTSTNVTGSCTAGNGFRDSNNSLLTVAGGTSFGAPIFAGMMAIINQKTGKAQGVANGKLYSLATNSATYASAFHDTTSGNNNCSLAGTTLCPTNIPPYSNYSAGTGYDLATGLGSVDFTNLLSAWSGSTSGKGFTLSASNVTVAAGGTGTSTVTITPQNGYTGTVAWAVSSNPSSSSLCFSMGSATVSGTSAVTASLTVKTSSSACGTAANLDATESRKFAGLLVRTDARNDWPSSLLGFTQAGLALVAVVLIGWGGRRSRPLRVAGCALILIALGLMSQGCSGTSSSPSGPPSGNAAAGTYTVTILGTDTATSSITASTTMTLTID